MMALASVELERLVSEPDALTVLTIKWYCFITGGELYMCCDFTTKFSTPCYIADLRFLSLWYLLLLKQEKF